MSDFVEVLGCLTPFFVLLLIWAVWSARRARREAREVHENLKALSQRLDHFERRLMDLRRESRGTEVAPAPVQVAPPVYAPPPVAVEPPAPAPAPAASTTVPPTATPPAAPPPAPPAVPSFRVSPPQPPSRGFDWENIISVRAFAWLGGIAFFLGAALFLQYSIQRGLISPAMRVAIGLVVGSAALIWGDSLRARSMWAGQATSGAGVAVLYASFFAAHTRYQLIGTTVTFAAMALVTVVAGLLAVRRKASILAVIGLIGGFLTPYLLATKEDHPVGLLAYVLLLDVGILAVARKRSWAVLPLLGLAGSAMLYAGWSAAHLDAGKLPYAMGAAILVGSLFVFGTRDEARKLAPGDWRKAAPVLGAMAPFLVAMLVSPTRSLDVSPLFLVVYLILLSVQAGFVGRESSVPLVPAAAAISVFSLVFRVAPDLFPSHRDTTLLLYELIPLTFLLLWLLRRDPEDASGAWIGAAVALLGSLIVVFRVMDVEPRTEPILTLWLYAAAHAMGLLVLAGVLRAGGWVLASQAYMLVTLLTLTTRYTNGRLSEFLPPILVPIVIYWALPFVSDRFRGDRLAWLSAGIAPVVHFVFLYSLARPVWGTTRLGIASVVLGALAFVALRRVLTMPGDPAQRRFTAALFGGVTLLFLTAAIPILLDKEWITVAWALEAAALAWLSTRIREDGLLYACGALAAATFVRLVVNPSLWSYHPRDPTPIFNWYLYTFGVPAIAFLLAAHWLRNETSAKEMKLPTLLRLFAGVLVFVLLNVEIADFYSTGTTLDFRLSGGGLAQDMTYSLAWGLFALVVLLLGITRKSKATRAAALVVLLLTIGKVFLHDLWDLGSLYRVGSIVGLGVALLAVSFLTQRYVFSREES